MAFRFSLPIDPKAGEWKHEIVERAIYSIGAFGFYGLLSYFVFSYPFLLNSLYYLVMALFVAIAAEPEGLVRRSWIVWVGLFVTFFVSFVAVKMLANWMHEPGLTLGPLGALHGGLWGLAAGICARSLFGASLGMALGSLGGYLSMYLSMYLWKVWIVSESGDGTFPVGKLVVVSVLVGLVRSLFVGIAVWAGVKFSKRRADSP
ncbi:MAG: hypothetical protein HY291_03075 [Planctomycetes bacterium]|nr:hypothetical protein [Planctomycetota bacterium]